MPPERHGALRRVDPRQGGVLLVRAKAEPTPRVGRPDPLRTHLQKPDSHRIPFPCVLSVFLLLRAGWEMASCLLRHRGPRLRGH